MGRALAIRGCDGLAEHRLQDEGLFWAHCRHSSCGKAVTRSPCGLPRPTGDCSLGLIDSAWQLHFRGNRHPQHRQWLPASCLYRHPPGYPVIRQAPRLRRCQEGYFAQPVLAAGKQVPGNTAGRPASVRAALDSGARQFCGRLERLLLAARGQSGVQQRELARISAWFAQRSHANLATNQS